MVKGNYSVCVQGQADRQKDTVRNGDRSRETGGWTDRCEWRSGRWDREEYSGTEMERWRDGETDRTREGMDSSCV